VRDRVLWVWCVGWFALTACVSPDARAEDWKINFLQTDKLLYRPNERGTVSVSISNGRSSPQTARVEVTLVRELADEQVLRTQQLKLRGGEGKRLDIPFQAEGRFGAEVRVRVTGGDAATTAHEYFSVAENFFDVGIGSRWGTDLHTGLAKHRLVHEKARRIYSNWFELFFWAPCDWSRLVSPLDYWWSGQGSYPESERNLRELIASCQKEGIRVAAYASANPAGPFGWETARAHPEMFRRNAYGAFEGIYNVEHLDLWNDPVWRRQPRQTGWYLLKLDLRRFDTLDWGIDQIVDSVRHYGWDAIRFDGHYTVRGYDELSTRNMRRLKERAWNEVPELRFGFNYGRSPEWQGGVTHEMREALAGGALYLQEGISNWRYTDKQYENWSHYAENELRVAKQVQALGGSYHCILATEALKPPQALYKLIYSLIAGGHPFYGEHAGVTGCSNWGAFLTRWSAMLWDLRLRPLEAAAERFSVRGDSRIQWDRLAQERIESPKRKFLVLHLVNPPPSDRIADTELPPATGKLDIEFRPRSGEDVRRVSLIRPDAPDFETDVSWQEKGNALQVTVPSIRNWGMLVWELEGEFEPLAEVAKFSDPPDAKQVESAMGKELGRSSADPNQRVATNVAENTEIWETNTGFTGYGIKTIVADSDADDGLAQNRDVDAAKSATPTPFLGRPYMGPIPAGRYRVGVRLKRICADPKGPQQVRFRVHQDKTDKELAVIFIHTPGYPNAQVGEQLVFAPSDQYAVYSAEIELKEADMIQASVWPAGEQAKSSLRLDHIEIETLESYGDSKLAELKRGQAPQKPAGLRTPAGAAPRTGLVVRGLFWQQYGAAPKTWDARYDLPSTYEEIYRYDAIVLANVDARNTSYECRKAIFDWVHDGGRLVVLGGIYSLGQGGMASTYFADMLPFQLRGSKEVVKCDPPLVLGNEPDKPFSESPLLFWRHDVTLRDKGTRPLAYAGGEPVLAKSDVGRGQVFAFAGTALGEPAEGKHAFWQTAAWRDLWRQMCGPTAKQR
jgi:uncharacterized membrane protein